MESSNSGNLQSSSSGVDHEGDSCHAESFSTLLNFPPPQQPRFMTSTTTSLDPSSPFIAHFPPLRPSPADPNTLRIARGGGGGGSSSPSYSHPNCTNADVSATTVGSISSTLSPVQQSGHAPSSPGGSKKRSRASRRDHTTVLTTDPSNFRAMVQQFTGFPAPPFAPSSSSSAYSRPRLHFFDHLGASAPPAATYNFLRSSAQKLQSPLIPLIGSSSTSVDVIASIARNGVGYLDKPPNTAGSTSNLKITPSVPQNCSPMHAQNATRDSQTPILQPQGISELYASNSSSWSLPSLEVQQQGTSRGAPGTAHGVKSIHRTDGRWSGQSNDHGVGEARHEPTNQSYGSDEASE